MKRWKTRDGTDLLILGGAEEEILFERARAMYEGKAPMEQIAQLYLAVDSVLYLGRPGAEVVKLPLYLALRDMATRRGVEQGLLSEGSEGSRPDLDRFKVRDEN
jgi:hypothetical protein